MKDVIKFIQKNKDYYSEYLINNRINKCHYGYTCDIDQIYCFLRKIKLEDTVYYNFYKLSNQYFDFQHKKVLEVSCGYIPILASIYQQNNIDIDVINKKILIKNYKGINTIECDFNKEFNLKSYDIIIGLRPCDATEEILESCIKYNKEFIIYLCPCIHKPKEPEIQISNYEEWIKYLKEKLFKQDNYDITIISQETFPDNCPIIIGKHKNCK